MPIRTRFAVREGLDYPIPAVASRLPYFLGSLTLAGIAILLATGVYLTQFYNPDAQASHQSVLFIITRAPLGDFLRSLHSWSADLVLVTVVLHLCWVFWRGSYRPPREVTWWAGVLLLGVIFLFHFTGTALPQDQAGYEAMAHYIAGARGAGLFGKPFLPELTPSVEVVARLYAMHISILPILLFGLLALHLYLIRFLGIHTLPGEDAVGGRFPAHLRRIAAHGCFLLAAAGLAAIIFPAELGHRAVAGAEVTKPPFFFLWIYALENWFGALALTFGPPLVYLLLFLPPLIDRRPPGRPQDRRSVLIAGYGLLAVLLGLAVYAWVAPAQQHLM